MSNKKAVARKEMSRWGWTWMMMKQYRIGYLMIAPFMIMFFIFTIIPVAASLLLSFTSYNMIQMPKFIFMQNYIQLFLIEKYNDLCDSNRPRVVLHFTYNRVVP